MWGPIHVEMDDDVSKKDITDLKSLAKAIKDKHVFPVKAEMNIGVNDPSMTTEIEFAEANPPPSYEAFMTHVGGYGMTEQQTKKVYTLVVHGALQWDFHDPFSLWDQLVAEGLVIPIAPAAYVKPEALPSAKVYTFQNICNHALNVCGKELGPGEVWKWHDFTFTDAMKNEVQAYIKAGVLQAFNNEYADLFEPPVEGVLRTFKNISGHELIVGTTVVHHYEIFSIKMLPGDENSETVEAYIKQMLVREVDPKIIPAPPAALIKGIAGPTVKPVMVASLDDMKQHFGAINPDSSTSQAISELLSSSLEEEDTLDAYAVGLEEAKKLSKKLNQPILVAKQNPLAVDEDYYIDSKTGEVIPEPATEDKGLKQAALISPVGKQWATEPIHKKPEGGWGTATFKKSKAKAALIPKGKVFHFTMPWDGTLPEGMLVQQAHEPNTQQAKTLYAKVAAPDLKAMIQAAKPAVKAVTAKAKAQHQAKKEKLGKSIHLNDLIGKILMPKSVLEQDFDEPDGDYDRTFVISDVHGCLEELQQLLERIGYKHGSDRLIFVGDLVDRGPNSLGVFRFVFGLGAEVVMGNHEEKYFRYWKHEMTGEPHNMKLKPHQLALYNQFDTEDFLHMATFPTSIHVGTFEGENFTAVHAGFEPGRHPDFQRDDKIIRVRYVDAEGMYLSGTPGQIPKGGVRWTKLYKGPHHVIYGHAVRNLVMPTVEGDKAQTIGIDTGCVMGGHLTAFELPSRRFHMVRAQKKYSPLMLDDADA